VSADIQAQNQMLFDAMAPEEQQRVLAAQGERAAAEGRTRGGDGGRQEQAPHEVRIGRPRLRPRRRRRLGRPARRRRRRHLVEPKERAMRHVKLTIATPEDEVLDEYFVSVPESELSPEQEITEVVVDSLECAETLENLLKLDAINAVTEKGERR
jgi:hypothetical protein